MQGMVAYWLPKSGTDAADWEDGAAYSRESGWFAVADGASTGAHSREWAFTLTRAFVTDRPDLAFDPTGAGFAGWLERTRAGFDPQSTHFSVSRAPDWVKAAGSRRGSHATLLAGRLTLSRIDAVAVGDCCLVHLRAGRLLRVFPLNRSEDFGSTPDLVSSRPTTEPVRTSATKYYQEEWSEDDVLLVASDAFAEWMIRNIDDTAVFDLLRRIGHRGFRQLCTDLRDARQMKNDDVTLFRAGASTHQGAA